MKDLSAKIFLVFSIIALLFLGQSIGAVPAHAATIADGDLIRVNGTLDVFIVKLVAAKKFKRLILNPAIFESYGHLRWDDVQDVPESTVDEFITSNLAIEVNPDGSVADPRVYVINSVADSDVGERRHLNIIPSEFEAAGLDWDAIYKINYTEALPSFYPIKAQLTATDDVYTWAVDVRGKLDDIQQIINNDVSAQEAPSEEQGTEEEPSNELTYNELHCPRITKIEDNLGNVGETSISGTFQKGSVDTIILKITVIDPQNLPLYYWYLPEIALAPLLPYADWTTEKTATISVSDAYVGGSRHGWIRVDNQDSYSCMGANYDTQAYFTYDVTPAEVETPQYTGPEIILFEADKVKAALGDELTLTWETKNAITCAIVETRNISIPFTGRLPNGSTTFTLEETTNEKIPTFNYYAICADKDWNTTVKELQVTINNHWQVVPHFDTNDAWSYANANNKCGLNLTYDSSPNGGIPDYSMEEPIWPYDRISFGTLMLNVGNNEPLEGLYVKSLTFQKEGTVEIENIDLMVGFSSYGDDLVFNREYIGNDKAIFSSLDVNGIEWPFTLYLFIDANRISIGETFGFSLVDMQLAEANSVDDLSFPNGLPVQSESPSLLVRCETTN